MAVSCRGRATSLGKYFNCSTINH